MATRKKDTREFRDSAAIKLITEQECQIAGAARNLGIDATMLGRWKREFEGGVDGGLDSANGKALQSYFFLAKSLCCVVSSNRFTAFHC